MGKEHKKLLVTGHARSGTMFIAALLQSCGVAVGFEQMGPDGIVAGHFTVPDYPTPYDGSQGKDFSFKHTLQVVRDPKKVLSSFFFTEPDVVPDRHRRWIDIPQVGRFEACIWSIVNWNKLIEAKKPELVFKVEDCPNVLINWLRGHGFPSDRSKLPKPGINKRAHRPLTDEAIKAEIGPESLEVFNAHCEQYGYEGLK